MVCSEQVPIEQIASPVDAFHPLDLLLRSFGGMVRLAGRTVLGNRRGCGELENRITAFSSFQRGARLGSAAASSDSLLRRFDGNGDAYRRLWILEGIGFGLAERSLEGGGPGGRFPFGGGGALPKGAEIPLHTGAGLAIASHLLLRSGGSGARVKTLLGTFIEHCRSVSAEGWDGVAFEGLGLAVRTLRPSLSSGIHRALAGDPRRRALFWHGAGRGLYFTPSHLWPKGREWSALEEAAAGGEDPLIRENQVAGLAWALTLVNIRQPHLVEARWRSNRSDSAERPFRFGVATALRIWFERYGIDRHLARFLRYEEPTWDPGTRERWRSSLRPFLAPGAGTGGREIEALFRLPTLPGTPEEAS